MARGVHDLGGQPAGPIDRHEHEPSFWDRRVDALQQLMSDPRRRFWRADEFRLAVESLEPADYRRLRYYERWISAVSRLLLEKGILTEEELRSRIETLRKKRP
jgi:nitrile hydratase subunit beta